MKRSILLLFVITTHVTLAQTTRIVDHNFNAPTGANIYSTIQAAVNASDSGDIIQVQPSPVAYGNVSIDRGVTLMGIGFNLTKDIALQSNMGTITLTNKADGTSDASGTIITGLTFTWLYVGNLTGPFFTLSDVTVYNCYLNYVYGGSSTYATVENFQIYDCRVTTYITFNQKIYNSWIRNNAITGYIALNNNSPCSATITNNILFGYVTVSATGSSVFVLNNDFIGTSGSTYAFSTLYDITVANNLFYGRTPGPNAAGTITTTFQRNIFTNNISYATGNDALPLAGTPIGTNTGDGNLIGTDPTLVDLQSLTAYSSASDFTLTLGSPAIGTGSDGTDIGITGGFYKWIGTNLVLKTTAAPTIETLNTSTVINPTDPLPVRVKAKSN